MTPSQADEVSAGSRDRCLRAVGPGADGGRGGRGGGAAGAAPSGVGAPRSPLAAAGGAARAGGVGGLFPSLLPGLLPGRSRAGRAAARAAGRVRAARMRPGQARGCRAGRSLLPSWRCAGLGARCPAAEAAPGALRRQPGAGAEGTARFWALASLRTGVSCDPRGDLWGRSAAPHFLGAVLARFRGL